MSESSRHATSVCVVIPAYKAAATISNALASVHKSSVACEVIVVEDGVFDDLQSVVARRGQVKLIVKDVNAGAAAARNTGLAACNSEYVFFLDSDDYVDPVLIGSLQSALESSNADVAFGPWCFVYDEQPSDNLKIPALRSNEDTVAAWLRNECYPPCCVMWRTESLRRIGGWDESYRHNDDAELVIRAMMSGLKLTVTKNGCGYYVQHDSPDRVSRASITVASEVAEKIFQKVFAWKDGLQHPELKKSLAYFAYEQARRAHRGRERALGSQWLLRSRSLGFQGHAGTRAHRFLAAVVGLGMKERLASFRDLVPLLRHRYK